MLTAQINQRREQQKMLVHQQSQQQSSGLRVWACAVEAICRQG